MEHTLFGYLYVELIGPSGSEVIRELTHAGIPLYDVRVHGEVSSVGVALSDFSVLHHVCRSRRVKVHFIRKEGLPFLWRNIRRRKSMVAGLLLFAVMLYVFQSLVWQVNVSGVDAEDAALIRHVARQAGIYPGSFKNSLPPVDEMQSRLQDQLPSMMWIGVNVVGTQVRIQALKKVEGVKTQEDNPHNIVAARPAVIRRVYATRGSVVVKPGQTVQPGTLLISGSLGDGSKQVPATGVVLAEVWYKSDIEVPLHVADGAVTGQSVKFDSLQIGGLNIRVWGWKNPDYPAWYDQEQDTTWKIGHFQLPLVWRQVTRFETTKSQVQRSKQEATTTALALERQDVLTKPGQHRTILGQTVLQTEVRHGKLYATILTRSEEDIGTFAPIPEQKVQPESDQQQS